MTTIDQLFLTFVLNAFWQVALIAAVAALCAWLLRHAPTRYKHILWVTALAAAFGLPVITCLRLQNASFFSNPSRQTIFAQENAPIDSAEIALSSPAPGDAAADQSIGLNRDLAWTLISLYGLFLLFRGVRLFRRWTRTRAITRNAHPVELREDLHTIIARCQSSIGVSRVRVFCSRAVSVPMASGVFRPIVILPEPLLLEANADVLTSAIGHEFVHVARRDYLLNLIYEFVYLPLSFHPGAALVRRRINQTRELRADELVAERLLEPEVYARSLVQLAGAALPTAGRAQTITVGIADADILEVRIMSLLKESKPKTRGNKLMLVAVSLLLAVPCVAAGALAVRFNIDPQDLSTISQERKQQEQQVREQTEKEMKIREMKERRAREQEEREMKEKAESDPAFRAEMEAREIRRRLEREIEARHQATLARMAKVTMDQAIQIAIGQQPGKVLECSLVGEHWEEPGKLAKDGRVLYHVVILTGDEANPTKAHVLIDAIDGSVLKIEKEERNKEPNEQRGVAWRVG